MTLAEIQSLTFDQMPATDETIGVGRNRGIRYRFAKITATDAEGAEHTYHVRISNKGSRTIEDFGKTRDQLNRETQAAYDALLPTTKARLASLGFQSDYIGNLAIIGDCMEGRVKRLSLAAILGGKQRDTLLAAFPNVKTLDDAIVALRNPTT